jgi:cytochrome c biogenesis protein CcmG, thiol:disulfide interchange protein DsbE
MKTTALTLAVLLAAAAAYPQASTRAMAAAFSEKDISTGETVSLERYRGRVIMLNFWGPWCPPCRAEVPDFEDLQAEHAKQIVIIGAAVFSSYASVEQFSKDYAINYPLIWGSYELMEKYGQVSAVPTTIIIDRKGRIAERVVGSRSREQYEQMLRPLLDEKS